MRFSFVISDENNNPSSYVQSLKFLVSDTVGFIDYEYGFYNLQAFDIGNHFNEYAGECVTKVDLLLYYIRCTI